MILNLSNSAEVEQETEQENECEDAAFCTNGIAAQTKQVLLLLPIQPTWFSMTLNFQQR